MLPRTAACWCGQLSVTVDADPVRVSVCHCLACQRRTGSVFGAQARFPAESAQVQGQSKQYVRNRRLRKPPDAQLLPRLWCHSSLHGRRPGRTHCNPGRRVRRSDVPNSAILRLRGAHAQLGQHAQRYRAHALGRIEWRPTIPAQKRSPQTISAGSTFTLPSMICVVYAALSAFCVRSELNAARISDAKSSGSSHAGTARPCPPR